MNANPLQTGSDILDSRRRTALPAAFHELTRRANARLRLWRRRRRERRELARLGRLDDRMLRDVGLTRGHLEFLINKPFWRE